MKQTILVNKLRGADGKGLVWLKEIEVIPGKWISWSNVYLKLCRNWSMSKQEVRTTILIFYNIGLVEISPAGVKLDYILK